MNATLWNNSKSFLEKMAKECYPSEELTEEILDAIKLKSSVELDLLQYYAEDATCGKIIRIDTQNPKNTYTYPNLESIFVKEGNSIQWYITPEQEMFAEVEKAGTISKYIYREVVNEGILTEENPAENYKENTRSLYEVLTKANII